MAGQRIDDDGVPRVMLRTVQLLRCFTAEDATLSAGELVERSGLPRSTTHRIVGDLVRLGLLTRTASGRYAIGTLIWELGHLTHIHVRLREVAQVHLTRLYDACGENVLLAVLTNDVPETAEVMFVGHLKGPRSADILAHEGVHLPLHATAIGKALVSVQPTPWIERFLSHPLEAMTPRTITEPELLRAEFNRARELGYATQHEETRPGDVAIATPIPSGDDYPEAAISVAGSVRRWDEARLASMIKRTAHAIVRDMHRAPFG